MVNDRNCAHNGSSPLRRAKRLLATHVVPAMAAVALYYSREAYIRAGACENRIERGNSGFWSLLGFGSTGFVRLIGFITVISLAFLAVAVAVSTWEDRERGHSSAARRSLAGATPAVSSASSIDSGSVKPCTCDKRRTKKSAAAGRARLNIEYEGSSLAPVEAQLIRLSEPAAQAAKVYVRDVQQGKLEQQELLAPRSTASKKVISKAILAAKNSILQETMKPVAGVVTQGVDTSLHQHATSESVPQKRLETYAISKEEISSPRAVKPTSGDLQRGKSSLGSTRSSRIKAVRGGASGTPRSGPSTSVESATCQGCIMCDMMERYDYGKLLKQPDDNAYMYQAYLNMWQQAHGGMGL
ncbi:hypothetical protein R4I06_00960 [Anaplasma bovis]